MAGNHVSLLDPIIIGVACPRKLNFMAKNDLFRVPFFSSIIRKLGAFPVKRNRMDTFALKEALRRLNAGNALVLFPEGRRSVGNDTLIPPRAGVGFLVSRVNIPIIPAFISGTEKALPKGAKFFRPVRINVHFGNQIYIKRDTPYQDIAFTIMKSIRNADGRG